MYGRAPVQVVGDYFEGESALPDVVLFGTSWCAANQMVRRYLVRNGIPHRYFDIEQSPSAERELRWITGGKRNRNGTL